MSGVRRYQDPELYERLAAEYVLGTLRGRARARFERLLRERPYIRYAVEVWEARLNPLAEALPPERPDPAVWQAIRAQLPPPAAAPRPWWQSLGLWRFATAVLGVALVAVLLWPRMNPHVALPSYVAVLESSGNEPMMVTLGDQRRRMIVVRLTEKPKLPPGRKLQLWAIHEPDHRMVPVAAVPLDRMEATFRLSRRQWQRIEGAQMFAVTPEPMDRQRMDKPSGPMMYKGKCIEFI